MSDDLVKILDGNTFVVSDTRGDIEASLDDPTGLFTYDTRFLSRWVLTIDGQRLNALSTDDLQYFEARFFLVPGTGTVYIDAKMSVIRQRAVGDGFFETLAIINHDEKPAAVSVRIEAGCDFADLFEVKDNLEKKGKYYTRVDSDQLVLGYERETFRRETAISAGDGAHIEAEKFYVTIPEGRMVDRPEGRHVDGRLQRTACVDQVRTRRAARPSEYGTRPRQVARRRARPRVRLAVAATHLPPQPRGPRRAPLLADHRGPPQPPRRRTAVVHDDLRTRQHHHEPAGTPVHVRARRDDVVLAYEDRLDDFATRTPVASCTRCATAMIVR